MAMSWGSFLAWSVGAVLGVDRGEPALYFEAAAQSVSSPTFLEGQPVKGLVGSSGPLLMFGGSDVVPSRMPVSAVSWAWTPLVLQGSHTEQPYTPAVADICFVTVHTNWQFPVFYWLRSTYTGIKISSWPDVVADILFGQF